MLILATLSLPAYDVATSSRIGAIILHGPHHSAQKSTSTGSLDFSTCSSNCSSLTWAILVFTRGYSNGSGAGGPAGKSKYGAKSGGRGALRLHLWGCATRGRVLRVRRGG